MDFTDFSALLKTCAPDVHQQTMSAVVKTESGFKPLAIGVNKSNLRLKRQPESYQEAVSTAKWLISHGYNIDMGYAQINSANLKWLGMTIEDMFDECKNLGAGARILTENYTNARKRFSEPQHALRAALSAYNTGNHSSGIRNGYVQKVSQNAHPAPAKRGVSQDVAFPPIPLAMPSFKEKLPQTSKPVPSRNRERPAEIVYPQTRNLTGDGNETVLVYR